MPLVDIGYHSTPGRDNRRIAARLEPHTQHTEAAYRGGDAVLVGLFSKKYYLKQFLRNLGVCTLPLDRSQHLRRRNNPRLEPS